MLGIVKSQIWSNLKLERQVNSKFIKVKKQKKKIVIYLSNYSGYYSYLCCFAQNNLNSVASCLQVYSILLLVSLEQFRKQEKCYEPLNSLPTKNKNK